MSESKANENQQKPVNEYLKELIQPAVEKQYGNDDINTLVETIINYLDKHYMHKSRIILMSYLTQNDKGSFINIFAGNMPKSFIMQSLGEIQVECVKIAQYMEYMAHQQKQAEKKIITPGDNGKVHNRIEGL